MWDILFSECVFFIISSLLKVVSSGNLCLEFGFGVELFNQLPDGYFLARNQNSLNLADCATSCGLKWDCVSFFYHMTTSECRHYRSKMSALNLDSSNGWYGYELTGRPISEAYSECNDGYTFDVESSMCYKVHTNMQKGTKAISTCRSEGAELVMLNTQAKKTVVEQIVQQDGSNEYFIGAKDDVIDGEWRWIADNSLITWYTKTDTASNCFEIEASLRYDDTGCNDQQQKFICERLL